MLAVAGSAVAQPRGGPGGNAAPAALSGNVYDADLSEPVEYANIVLYRQRDSTQSGLTSIMPRSRFCPAGGLCSIVTAPTAKLPPRSSASSSTIRPP